MAWILSLLYHLSYQLLPLSIILAFLLLISGYLHPVSLMMNALGFSWFDFSLSGALFTMDYHCPDLTPLIPAIQHRPLSGGSTFLHPALPCLSQVESNICRKTLCTLRFGTSRQQVIETLDIYTKKKKKTSVVYMIHASRLKDSILQT